MKKNLKNMTGNIRHLLNAVKVSLKQGGSFLESRCIPNGPIMQEQNLSYIHKATWGMYASGVEHSLIAKLLDWAMEKALQPNGDFYFPDEAPEYKDMQRLYRPLTFGKVAVWIDHPVMKKQRVIDRILQYQHESGGVFNYIGDDPDNIQEQDTIGTLNTSFFGHLMLALDMKEQAIKAGNWLCNFVDANREYMSKNIMYCNMTPAGDLVTHLEPGENISGKLDYISPKQEFWQPGTVMAYLAVLYEKMLDSWGYSEESAQPYLDSALTLLEFESGMPLYTYLWPSKCKVGWGAGEILRIMVKYSIGNEEQLYKAYKAARKVAIFTFMDNQLPHGGWSCMHYPLSELIPEMAFEYKPLKGIINVPDKQIPDSQNIFLPAEEISGEFLGEMEAIKRGLEEVLKKL
ncbi:hypothetical protein GF312_02850 [Candidatus Poribacteria bacterium]|nr:hypothetical protein [Candidatus Poribacteria bacterium]